MNDEPLVEFRSVGHEYGRRTALDDVSFSVDRASFFALLGPNGCGKTTLLRILTTLLTPTKGAAFVGGANVVTERARVLEQIGVVFQHPSIDRELTVEENLYCQGQLYGMTGRPLRDRVRNLLAVFGIDDRARERTATLSGGLQRKVELAKALLHDPQLLILDEPGAGLDPSARLAMMALIEELRDTHGLTCLLTTHLMDEADRCDQVGILDEGRLVALDSPASLKGATGKDVVTIDTASPKEVITTLAKRFGIGAQIVASSVRFELKRGATFLPELMTVLDEKAERVTVAKPTLDDVFLRMTGHRLQ